MTDQHRVAHNCEVVQKRRCMVFKILSKSNLVCRVLHSASILCRATFLYTSLRYVSTSFAHPETEIFAHSSLQNSSSSGRFDGERLWTAVFKSRHRWDLDLDFGHFNTWIFFGLNHSIVSFAVCFQSLSCSKANLLPSLKSLVASYSCENYHFNLSQTDLLRNK